MLAAGIRESGSFPTTWIRRDLRRALLNGKKRRSKRGEDPMTHILAGSAGHRSWNAALRGG